jgi:peroxiredoxin family protein
MPMLSAIIQRRKHKKHAIYEVLTVVTAKLNVFWKVIPCSVTNQTFGGNEEDSSETLIMIYQTVQHIPEISNLNS